MHDLTIKRRQSNYDKHLNAIVWLYCREVDKYAALLREYRTVLGSDKPFAEQMHELSEQAKALRAEAKKAVETAEKREKKKIQEEYDLRLAEITDMLTVTSEAWGEYGVNTPQLAVGKFIGE